MRRAVITGLGILCPLGLGVEAVWRRLLSGHSGIGAINVTNSDALASRIAGQVPAGRRAEHRLDLDEWFSPIEQQTLARFTQFAVIAALEAVEDAGWKPSTATQAEMTGLCIGSGCGGLGVLHEATGRLHQGHGSGSQADFLRGAMLDHAAEMVAARLGFSGPRQVVSTACASGTHAIGDAARMIHFGDADIVLAGGAEAAISELAMAGFAAARALSTGFNDAPARASRPWDRDRDGFVMAEGAGMLVVEDLDHARARGARIYAEIAGYGMTGDAHHITGPADGHDGAYRAMRSALRSAGMTPSDIQYVNAHGTSTPLGDDLELEAVERLFGADARRLAMSSTKSSIGHLLGAAGAVESIFSALSIRDRVAPPTLNLDNPSRDSVIDRIAGTAQARDIQAVLSNSFGFGGSNASLVLRAV